MARRNKRNKRKKTSKLLLLFIIVGLLGGAFGAYGFSMLDKINNTKISQSDEDLGINNEDNKSSKVVNIALFGLDRRESKGNTRSDTIMIASLDKEHKKIKLTSIMRDTYVDIPGRGMDKINHAYAFGGPELAIKTINQNFAMNIRDFVTVDFYGLEKIIDAMGGIEIEIASNEVNSLNKNITEINDITKENSPKVNNSGLQTLTGRQAVAYARIRNIGNGDYQRTERQRLVLEQVIHKGMNAGITKYPKLLNTMLPYVETSLSKTDMVSLGTSTLTSGIRTIDQYRIPVDGYGGGQKINGVSYIVPNTLEDNIKLLNQFIYEDMKVTTRKN
ncbi:LCP family protein [Irregularibacter muris]|uniref:LCP family protein n=1 Tax=Irregularibacter muris TaxID=1796619 RepID=A0AAE3L4H6_9FIRM|nr:LCP family protein [Irregularibacter muris]MCR1900078.1 LCP family protein [Irregularibacter muris]